MIFKELRVKNFGKIDCFETSFDSQLTVISAKYADDVIKAIGVVTDNQTLSGNETKQMLSENTHIRAVLEMHGDTFRFDFTGISPVGKRKAFAYYTNHFVNPAELLKDIYLCKEEESLIYYRFDRKNAYSDLLFNIHTERIIRKVLDTFEIAENSGLKSIRIKGDGSRHYRYSCNETVHFP